MFDDVKPWRLTGRDTRDNWRVCAITILSMDPLALAGPSPATRRTLKDALKAHPRQPIILTAGLRSIVIPLLAEMGFVGATTIASRMYRSADLRNGRLHTHRAGSGPKP